MDCEDVELSARAGARRTVEHCYEILRPLGSGGSGVVYLARYFGPDGFNRLVALKVLLGDVELSDDAARRLRDEARILGMLRHRGLVRVDRLLSVGRRSAISMEHVEGASLARLLELGPLPPRIAFEIAAEMAATLHFLHHATGPDGVALQLVHRDLKPSNVMLSAEGEVKLLDFGIARAGFSEREAFTREVSLGTPGYAAPERLLGQGDAPCDLYGLGAVLWEMLTGRPLRILALDPDAHEEQISQVIRRLRRIDPPLPEAAWALLRDLLAWRPGDRPTAQEAGFLSRRVAEALPGPTLRTWADREVRNRPDTLMSRDPLGWSGVFLPEDTPRREEAGRAGATGGPGLATQLEALRTARGRLGMAGGVLLGLIFLLAGAGGGPGTPPSVEAPPEAPAPLSEVAAAVVVSPPPPPPPLGRSTCSEGSLLVSYDGPPGAVLRDEQGGVLGLPACLLEQERYRVELPGALDPAPRFAVVRPEGAVALTLRCDGRRCSLDGSATR